MVEMVRNSAHFFAHKAAVHALPRMLDVRPDAGEGQQKAVARYRINEMLRLREIMERLQGPLRPRSATIRYDKKFAGNYKSGVT